ncbi:MAG: hypothetical protein ABIP53_12160 [Candidatus Limnocylindrales bacterium]
MDDHKDDPMAAQDEWGHATEPETDGSANPTEASADEGSRARGGREMLVQLQQMIDTLAMQAAPVMREVAAKAAELAAVAGEKAGPLAHKAAGMTENMGQRVAARSKVMAADLRRSQPRDERDETVADMADVADEEAVGE